MKKQKSIILMADIINSRKGRQSLLMKKFKGIVDEITIQNKSNFHSPPTITLGDEFQAIATSVESCCEVLINMEELILEKGVGFKLRYVIYEGQIDTKINKKIAYGMLGDGLTKARVRMNDLKTSKNRFEFTLDDTPKMKILNDIYWIMASQIDAWKPKDYHLISLFIKEHSYKEIANIMEKDNSLIWRRKKSLDMEQYQRIKNIIHTINLYE